MTLTLLLDLDDTLLENDIQKFVPVYLNALGKHLANYVAPDMMAQTLMAATQVMIANNSAVLSLEESFDQAFYPAIGHSKADMRPTIERFYEEIFPGLSWLAKQRPDAIQLVRHAQEKGHTMVVATNPIFPYRAIYHRLRWAGLEPEHTPFALITSYEHFHYAKPNPAYFAEILAQLGWPNQPAVMIGNSLEDDLTPANQLGMPVFWITDQNAKLPAGFHPLSACGGLADASRWIDMVDHANPRLEFLTPRAHLSVLKSTPAGLDTLASRLNETQWRERPAPDEWSLTEIFCHLRDVDRDVNLVRFEKVVEGRNPFLPGINTDTWAQERDYQNQDGHAALREFIKTRDYLVTLLETLDREDWQQPARHAIFGPTHLEELVGFVATHDRTHMQQCLATASVTGR